MRTTRSIATVIALVLVFAACQESMPESSLVEKLRVLAIRAEDPEMTVTLRGGAQTIPVFDPPVTSLTALVADPKGGGRPVTLSWLVCTLQGIGEDAADFNCDGDNGLPLANGSFAPALLAGALMQKGITFDLAPSSGYGASLQGGVPVYLWLRAYAGQQTTAALKRIVLSSRSPRNRNPVLTGVDVDGVDITKAGEVSFKAARDYKVTPVWDAASLDVYLDELNGVETKEVPFFSWFATEGDWKDVYTDPSSPSNRWRTPAVKDGQPKRVDMWFVMHDKRGGSHWYTLNGAMIVP